ncbi:hypothetical protein KQX54_009546 [Cotesia glomerata]|uniref:Uncharacterized protein n=1 Tax=Cotesia glomerata TaxID=32391 RepID=A0AAV7ICT9_COTGL|nr:hypothetical protein KQX54_009546 [Cotesia glomerata]
MTTRIIVCLRLNNSNAELYCCTGIPVKFEIDGDDDGGLSIEILQPTINQIDEPNTVTLIHLYIPDFCDEYLEVKKQKYKLKLNFKAEYCLWGLIFRFTVSSFYTVFTCEFTFESCVCEIHWEPFLYTVEKDKSEVKGYNQQAEQCGTNVYAHPL